MVKSLIIGTVAIFLLAGCEERYRYFCQEPEHWNNERCKKPICEVNKDCPEYIFKGTYMNGSNVPGLVPPVPAQPVQQQCTPIQQKGVCK